MPQTGRDAITIGTELNAGAANYVSRKLAPGVGAVVSVTEFLTDGQRTFARLRKIERRCARPFPRGPQ